MLNPQLSSMVITPEGITKITALLQELFSEANARSILLVEKSGQHLAMVGEESPHVMALSALVVGAFSSTREIARLLGEPEFKTMFQQGDRLNLFISLLDSQDLITVIFDERTTLGMIKLKTQQMTKRISEEIKNMGQSQVGQGPWR
ncbi:dynein regulation protein LC7 [bacterium (Candidatus Blackallbacteria) CG17_big_fil_post_rev_8_21_14_2_50_48_46]|uniref:Dynein regulation protein LC7 n=1 Tax=bacterium (Candidatus Blackallbacteria) CG17_big_fil_post_rev_8_21_14_2_50_48_46 TaxID=2014261 RepID=A0A2M7G954_9BACT|nr:MAG: dynein regulation protein LC7 [bacterium (Candidatus Blackallbacteria) CG18_big_fil_WC_8_21_14_2_50_49_26]PIW18384.1 MAG: dynein regulation protein LC7 [bacterium (Candidatus Blackallbacteria) CG17_big_fil_post_rev_8_21_14_2_50_48_46]PIW50543.1 MAG: dynein regulation protein LC7 [bacterium (Candidatus Blackallbacteria) CG13_big_fil_rev_8_21_14_2_50_49_14]